jgi:hypothetical protein
LHYMLKIQILLKPQNGLAYNKCTACLKDIKVI